MGKSKTNKRARGPKRHMKRVRAPKAWMLDKMGGIYATRPMQGPHKLRECIPLHTILRYKLKYALTGRESMVILKDPSNEVKVDGKVRREIKYPVGLMDVVTIPKTDDKYRVMYDVKGRFTFVPIREKESQYKLCKVVKKFNGPNKVPYMITHDARTIRFADPKIKIGDTINLNLATGEIKEHYRMKQGNVCMLTGGNNKGRVGIVTDIMFTTRLGNVFIIGNGDKAEITLPKDKGVK